MSLPITEVTLAHGMKVQRFYDPPHAHYDGAPDPVERWRVQMPRWFPTGSWLDGPHAFATLQDALDALEETGAVEAVEAYWIANSHLSAARHAAFSKLMSAHVRADKSYAELLRARHAEHRARLESG